MTGKAIPAAFRARRLSMLDAAFLGIERRETPMHVGALQIYSLPPGADPGFVGALVQRFRSPSRIDAPWNLKLAPVVFSRLAPAVVEVADIDYEFHVRHSALPHPGGQRELGELVSHLHGVVLDRGRPLCTCHVIEGLQGNRFAIYLKIHHALADGLRCIGMLARSLAPAPGGEVRAPWEKAPGSQDAVGAVDAKSPSARNPSSLREWGAILKQAIGPIIHRGADDAARVRPFTAPRSKLNGPVTNARRVATQQLDLRRAKQVAKRAGVSLNDVLLAVCSAALRTRWRGCVRSTHRLTRRRTTYGPFRQWRVRW